MKGVLDRERVLAELGETIGESFLGHCEELGEEDVQELLPHIDIHMEATFKSRSLDGSTDVWLAQRLVDACKGLLEHYPDLEPDQRSAVVGAVRYFIQARDVENDLESEDGFLDDARVVNYVIEAMDLDMPYVT